MLARASPLHFLCLVCCRRSLAQFPHCWVTSSDNMVVLYLLDWTSPPSVRGANSIYRLSGNSGGRRLRSSSSLSRVIRCVAPVVSLTNLDCMETSRAFCAAVRPAKKDYGEYRCDMFVSPEVKQSVVGGSVNQSLLLNKYIIINDQLIS